MPSRIATEDVSPGGPRRQGPVLPNLLKSAKNIGLALAFVLPLAAQTGTFSIYQATTPTASAAFNNINPRYNAWTVMYNYSGSGTFSIELDCASDATVAGGTATPGTFAACTNIVTGNNPSTTPAYGYMTFKGYTPWVKLNLTAISSGSLTAVAIGFQAADPELSGGCAGTINIPCVVGGNGNATATAASFGASQAGVSVSAGTDVVLVSGTAAKKTHLTRLGLAWDNAATVTIREGTTSSTPCDTSTATLDGPYGNMTLTALFQDYESDFSPLVTSATGLDICAHFSTSVTGGGGVSYSKF